MRAGNLLLVPLYLSLLSRIEYGAFGVVRNVVAVLVPVVVVGQVHSILRLGVEEDRRLLGSVVAWIVVAFAGVTAAAAGLWPWLSYAVEDVAWWPVGAAGLAVVLGQALFQVSQAWLRNERRAREHTVLALVRWGLLVVAVLALVGGLDLGTTGLLLALAASFLATAGVGLWRLREGLGLSAGLLKRSLAFGAPLLPHALASVLFLAADQVLLAALYEGGLDSAGLYLLGAQAVAVVHLLAQGIQQAWTPWFLRGAEPDAIRQRSFVALVAVAGAAAAVGLLAPELVGLAGIFSDQDWSDAAEPVPILVVGGLLRLPYLLAFVTLLSDVRRARWIAAVTVPAAVLNVALNLWWIPSHGMTGAAWATVCSWGAAAGGLWLLARRVRPLPFAYARASVVGAVVVGALLLAAGGGPMERIGALAAVGVALWALGRRDLRAVLSS